ncbi:MAG: SiaB family protein kinase [Desulfuromonadaceae bacterium]|nr:SiaB family protein kinase [Desulfuromonadaceae bacterium]
MDLYDLRKDFAESGIMMCFNGPFSHSIIEEIGIALRNHLAAEEIAKAAVLDVFAVYIELAQNVRNYLALREITQSEANSSIITIAHWGDGYTVASGNFILNSDADTLCTRIEEINNLTPEERKRQYREQMRREPAPSALGAGLGFLEIAKRSSAKMVCSVRKIDDIYGFFSLAAFI